MAAHGLPILSATVQHVRRHHAGEPIEKHRHNHQNFYPVGVNDGIRGDE
jgi:hypothetical protein